MAIFKNMSVKDNYNDYKVTVDEFGTDVFDSELNLFGAISMLNNGFILVLHPDRDAPDGKLHYAYFYEAKYSVTEKIVNLVSTKKYTYYDTWQRLKSFPTTGIAKFNAPNPNRQWVMFSVISTKDFSRCTSYVAEMVDKYNKRKEKLVTDSVWLAKYNLPNADIAEKVIDSMTALALLNKEEVKVINLTDLQEISRYACCYTTGKNDNYPKFVDIKPEIIMSRSIHEPLRFKLNFQLTAAGIELADDVYSEHLLPPFDIQGGFNR